MKASSPYLNRPLRTIDQVLAARCEAALLELEVYERAITLNLHDIADSHQALAETIAHHCQLK